VFVQLWVDTNALQNGSERGIYLVDNKVNDANNHGSTNEGTTNLSTNVTNHSNICWQVFNIDPNSTTTLSIASMSNAPVFGASGQPESVNDNTFTGQVQAVGSSPYQVTLNAEIPGSSGITATVSPSLVVY
jgi:hypothetical protein